MAAAKPVVLLADARQDLRDIWTYSSRIWGDGQADRYVAGLNRSFRTIESMPEIAREHTEFVPPVRVYPSAKHLIVYVIEEDLVSVVRVLASRTNWRNVLGG